MHLGITGNIVINEYGDRKPDYDIQIINNGSHHTIFTYRAGAQSLEEEGRPRHCVADRSWGRQHRCGGTMGWGLQLRGQKEQTEDTLRIGLSF